MTLTLTLTWLGLLKMLGITTAVVYVLGVIWVLVKDRGSGGLFTIRLGVRGAFFWPLIVGMLLWPRRRR